MLSSETPKKKKRVAVVNPRVVVKVPSLIDMVSAYVANKMLYEKCIEPRETGWYKGRWRSVGFGCYTMTTGQWRNGKELKWQLYWHCRLSVVDCVYDTLCDCAIIIDPRDLDDDCDDWVLLRNFSKEDDGRLVSVFTLKKTYDASRNVTLSACAGDYKELKMKSKLFKIAPRREGGWTDGFKIPQECLTEAFFTIEEMPARFKE